MENTTTHTTTRIRALLDALQEGLYEREQAMALALLAALAGESIFLLGPPGVAKSMIARRLKYAFRGGQSFEYLMNRFSTPDEVFGPVSISKLWLEDRYERQTERYLPGAQIVFLDEIWKAGPAIQNALLTVINEKVYRNGAQEVPVELRGLIAASNELPEKGQGLDALWDRFLLRLKVDNIQDRDNFFRMITSNGSAEEDPVPDELKITPEELREWSEQIDRVEVPEAVLQTIGIIRDQLESAVEESGKDLAVSDRRWKKIIRLLRTAAFTRGKEAVELIDCYLIPECLWNEPGQRTMIAHLVHLTIDNQTVGELESINQKIDQQWNEIQFYTVRVTEGVRKELKVHELSDGQRYHLIHLPNRKQYYIREQDFNALQYDQTTSMGLTYPYQGQLRLFPNAQVRRTRTPFVLIVGDEVGRLDTFEEATQVREYADPPAEVLSDLETGVEKLLTEVRSRIELVEHLEQTLPLAVEAHPYLQKRDAMWANLPKLRHLLNKRLMSVRRMKHSLYPPEVNTED